MIRQKDSLLERHDALPHPVSQGDRFLVSESDLVWEDISPLRKSNDVAVRVADLREGSFLGVLGNDRV